MVSVLLVAGMAHAAEGLPTVEDVEENLRGIQNNLKNAKMRVRHGMSALSPTEQGEDKSVRQPTPAEACCAPNLDRLRERIVALTQQLEQIYRHYAAEGNADATAKLEAVREPLQTVNAGVAQFKMAGTTDRAADALDGLIRPFLDLRAAVEELNACCLKSKADSKTSK